MSTPCKTDFTSTHRDVSHLLENENLLNLMIVFGCCFPYSPDSRYLSSESSTLMKDDVSPYFPRVSLEEEVGAKLDEIVTNVGTTNMFYCDCECVQIWPT